MFSVKFVVTTLSYDEMLKREYPDEAKSHFTWIERFIEYVDEDRLWLYPLPIHSLRSFLEEGDLACKG
jgi:hypothetical protein